jgi:origin recognition complex subunit 3
VVTGPNIASQSLLFEQISDRLKYEINGPVVILRSGDASNLKAALKQLIRDLTNQKSVDGEEECLSFDQDVSK